MSTHTLGPWRMAGQGKNKQLPIVADGKIIAAIRDWGTLGDARLIAAAPELLAACKAVAALSDGQGRANLLEVAGTARAAIAKAEGGDHA